MSETSSVLKNSQDIRKMASGSSFKAIFVVSSLFQKNDKNGKPYFEMTVTDQSGTLEAKIWSDAVWFDRSDPETDPSSPAKRLDDEKLKNVVGCTVGVEGKTTEFRGQIQFNFNKLTLLDQEKFPPSQYLPRSPIALDELLKRYEELVSSCCPEVAGFVRSVYEGTTWKQFRDWPAAVSHHHAYANGSTYAVGHRVRQGDGTLIHKVGLRYRRRYSDSGRTPSRPRQTWVLQDGFDPGDDP